MDDEWVETIRRNDELEKQKLIDSGKKLGFEDGKKSGFEDGKKSGFEDGKKSGIQTGFKNGIKEIIKNMLSLNESDQKIMLYTKAKKSEIEKVRKELQAQS